MALGAPPPRRRSRGFGVGAQDLHERRAKVGGLSVRAPEAHVQGPLPAMGGPLSIDL